MSTHTKNSLLVATLLPMLAAQASAASVVYLASDVTTTGGTLNGSETFRPTNGNGGNGTTISFLGSSTTLTSGVTTLEQALTYTQSPWNGSPNSDPDGRFVNGGFGSVNYNYSTALDLDGILLWNYNELVSGNTTYNERGITRADITVTYSGGATVVFDNVGFSLVTDSNAPTQTAAAQKFAFGSTLSGVTQVTLSDLQSGPQGPGAHAGWKEFAVYQVPEPSVALIGGIGMLGMLGLLRRRRN